MVIIITTTTTIIMVVDVVQVMQEVEKRLTHEETRNQSQKLAQNLIPKLDDYLR